jgi:hypothetical protein
MDRFVGVTLAHARARRVGFLGAAVGTTVTLERPMCLDPRQPISFTWGAPKTVP